MFNIGKTWDCHLLPFDKQVLPGETMPDKTLYFTEEFEIGMKKRSLRMEGYLVQEGDNWIAEVDLVYDKGLSTEDSLILDRQEFGIKAVAEIFLRSYPRLRFLGRITVEKYS